MKIDDSVARMPFDYQVDSVRRSVCVTYEGNFRFEEGLAILNRTHTEGVGGYRVLYDLSYLTGNPTVEHMRRFIREELRSTPLTGSRGPIAVVAVDDDIYRMACAYEVLGRPRLRIKVFRERAEAERWLQQGWPSLD